MCDPELSRGDRGPDVVRLQKLINRVGTMLVCDGDFGYMTERGVRFSQRLAEQPDTGTVDPDLWAWAEAQPAPFPRLTTEGVAMIAREETGGLPYYQAVTRWPHYPGVASGVTIGVGYDLRFKSEEEFRNTWGPLLSSEAIEELAKGIGLKGSKGRVRKLKQMGIEVPFDAAWSVFIRDTLSRFYNDTEAIYPSLPRLPDLCRSVLVSLVFNRGSSLSGSRRLEMRKIRDLLAEADNDQLHKAKRKIILNDVEDQLLAMQRLWEPGTGVSRRRQVEANYWRSGVTAW